MKKPLFHLKLYLESLRQLRLAGLSLAVTAVVLNVVVQLPLSASQTMIQPAYFSPVLSVCMYFGPVLLALAAFSFLFRRSGSDFFHALPYSRACLFLTRSLAALTYLALTNILGLLSSAALFALLKVPFVPLHACILFISYMVGSLLVLACALLGFSLSGNAFSGLILTVALLFLPRGISVLGAQLMTEQFSRLNVTTLSPLTDWTLNLPFRLIMDTLFNTDVLYPSLRTYVLLDFRTVLYTFLLGAAYIALGCLAFIKRPSEAAERPAPTTWQQHLYRCLLASPFFLIAAFFLLNGVSWSDDILYFLLVLGVAVYFLYELISTRSARGLLSALKVFPWVPIACFCVVGSFVLYGKLDASRSYTAENIRSFQLGYYTTDYQSLRRSEVRFTDPELISALADAIEYTNGQPPSRVTAVSYDEPVLMGTDDFSLPAVSVRNVVLDIGLGRRVVMGVEFSEPLDKAFTALLEQNEDYRATSCVLPEDKEILRISGDFSDEMLTSLREEFDALDYEKRCEVLLLDYSSSSAWSAPWYDTPTYVSEVPAEEAYVESTPDEPGMEPSAPVPLSGYENGAEPGEDAWLFYRQDGAVHPYDVRPYTVSFEGYRGLRRFYTQVQLNGDLPRTAMRCLREQQSGSSLRWRISQMRDALTLKPGEISQLYCYMEMVNIPSEGKLYGGEVSIGSKGVDEQVEWSEEQKTTLINMLLDGCTTEPHEDGCFAYVVLEAYIPNQNDYSGTYHHLNGLVELDEEDLKVLFSLPGCAPFVQPEANG